MQKKKLIVFDIDDTLTKSENQHQQAYMEAMRYFGITEIDQNWKGYAHVTDSYILKVNYERQFSRKFELSFISDFEKEMTKRFQKSPETKAILGAETTVNHILTETEYAICFATGSLWEPAMLKLAQAGINFVPELVVASNTIFERENIVKAAIEKAKEYYNVEKFNEVISFGDGLWDVTTARNLEVHFVGIGDKNKADFDREKVKCQLKDWTTFNIQNIEKQLGIN